MIPSFKKIRGLVDLVAKLQDNVDEVLRVISRKEILDGRIISDIEITSGTTKTVNHGLDRQPQGYIVIKNSSNAVIYGDTFTSSTLELDASANTTIDIWVF